MSSFSVDPWLGCKSISLPPSKAQTVLGVDYDLQPSHRVDPMMQLQIKDAGTPMTCAGGRAFRAAPPQFAATSFRTRNEVCISFRRPFSASGSPPPRRAAAACGKTPPQRQTTNDRRATTRGKRCRTSRMGPARERSPAYSCRPTRRWSPCRMRGRRPRPRRSICGWFRPC